jgi:hypothetical protein
MSVGTTGADYAPEYIPPQPEYVAEAPPPPPPEPELPPELPPVTDPAAQAAAPAANANLEQSAMSNLGTDPSAPVATATATPAPAGDVPGGAFSFNLPPIEAPAIEAPAIPGALPSGNGLSLGGSTSTSPLFDGTIPAAPAGGEPVKADPNFYAKAAQEMAPDLLKGAAKWVGTGMDNVANVGGGIQTAVGGMAKAGGDAFNTVTNGENYAKFGQEWQKDPLGATRDAIGGLGQSAWNIGPGVLALGGGVVTEVGKQVINAPLNVINSVAMITQQDDKVHLKTLDDNMVSASFKLLGDANTAVANTATSLTGMKNGSPEAEKMYGKDNSKSHTFDAFNAAGDTADFVLGVVTGKGLFDMAGDAIKGGLKKGGKEVVEEGAEQVAKQGAQQGAETAAGAPRPQPKPGGEPSITSEAGKAAPSTGYYMPNDGTAPPANILIDGQPRPNMAAALYDDGFRPEGVPKDAEVIARMDVRHGETNANSGTNIMRADGTDYPPSWMKLGGENGNELVHMTPAEASAAAEASGGHSHWFAGNHYPENPFTLRGGVELTPGARVSTQGLVPTMDALAPFTTNIGYSPVGRAKETAKIAFGGSLPDIGKSYPSLAERGMGPFIGANKTDELIKATKDPNFMPVGAEGPFVDMFGNRPITQIEAVTPYETGPDMAKRIATQTIPERLHQTPAGLTIDTSHQFTIGTLHNDLFQMQGDNLFGYKGTPGSGKGNPNYNPANFKPEAPGAYNPVTNPGGMMNTADAGAMMPNAAPQVSSFYRWTDEAGKVQTMPRVSGYGDIATPGLDINRLKREGMAAKIDTSIVKKDINAESLAQPGVQNQAEHYLHDLNQRIDAKKAAYDSDDAIRQVLTSADNPNVTAAQIDAGRKNIGDTIKQLEDAQRHLQSLGITPQPRP